jgi:hypothetical protein
MSIVKVISHEEDKLCNKCGKTVFIGQKGMTKVSSGMIDATVNFGYNDSVNELQLYDGDEYRFSLCSICLKELFDSFVIPREERCLLPGRPNSEKVFDSPDYYEQLPSEEDVKALEAEYLANNLSGEAFSRYSDADLVSSFSSIDSIREHEYIWLHLVRKGLNTKEKIDALFQEGNSELKNSEHSIWKFSVDAHETDSFTVFFHKITHISKRGFIVNPDNTCKFIETEPKEDAYWWQIFVLDKATQNYVPYSQCGKKELEIISNHIEKYELEYPNVKNIFDTKYLPLDSSVMQA